MGRIGGASEVRGRGSGRSRAAWGRGRGAPEDSPAAWGAEGRERLPGGHPAGGPPARLGDRGDAAGGAGHSSALTVFGPLGEAAGGD